MLDRIEEGASTRRLEVSGWKTKESEYRQTNGAGETEHRAGETEHRAG